MPSDRSTSSARATASARCAKPLGITAFGVNAIVYPPGYEGFHHYHDTQDELYFVHSGSARVEVEGEERVLGPGGLVHVESTTPRKVSNASETDDLVLLVIGGKDGYVERDGHMVDEADIARRAAFGSGRRRAAALGLLPLGAGGSPLKTRSRASRRALQARGSGRRAARLDAAEVAQQRADGGGREHVQVRGIVLRRQAAEETQPALHPERVRHASRRRRHPGAGRVATRRRARRGNRRCSRSSPATTASKLSSVERQRLVDVRDDRLDPERPAFASAARSTSTPTTSFPSRKCRVSAPERQPRSSTRLPCPIASTKSGIRSGTKTKSPASRRWRWCASYGSAERACSRGADGGLVPERGDRPAQAFLELDLRLPAEDLLARA